MTAVRRYKHPAGAGRDGTAAAAPARAYLGFLGLTLLNPMTIVYFEALVLGWRGRLDPLGAAVFVTGAFVASASWQLLLAGGGSLVGRVLTDRRGRLATALTASAVIVVLTVRLVVAA